MCTKIDDAGSEVSVIPSVTSQNARVRSASPTVQATSSGSTLPSLTEGSGRAVSSALDAPSGSSPTSSGLRRTVTQARGATAQTSTPISSQATRQPGPVATCAIAGASAIPAVAEPKVKIMNASDRFRMNQFAIAARGPSRPKPGVAIPKSAQHR